MSICSCEGRLNVPSSELLCSLETWLTCVFTPVKFHLMLCCFFLTPWQVTILLSPGKYTEDGLVINKPVVLRGTWQYHGFMGICIVCHYIEDVIFLLPKVFVITKGFFKTPSHQGSYSRSPLCGVQLFILLWSRRNYGWILLKVLGLVIFLVNKHHIHWCGSIRCQFVWFV